MEREDRSDVDIGAEKVKTLISDMENRKNELREYLDQLTTFSSKLAPNGTVLMVNAAVAGVEGESYAELVGRKLWEVPQLGYSKESRAKVRDAIRRAASGETVLFEISHPLVDGGYIVVDLSIKPVRNDMGEVSYLVVEGRDITERKRAEDALLESKQRLQMVLDTIPSHVFWKDLNSVFLGCNYLFAANAGLASPDEIVGKTDFDLPWAEQQAESYQADDRMVIETGVPKLNYEETQYTADGRVIWIRTSKIPLRDADGIIVGVLGTYEDVTALKMAEERILEEKRLSETIINAVPGIFYMIDDRGRILWRNRRMDETLINFEVDEAGTVDVLAAVAKEDYGIVLQSIQEVFAKGEAIAEFSIIHRDGTLHDYYCTGARVEIGGNRYIIGIGIDITERKRAEEEKRAFYREAIKNVTEGKLVLITRSEADECLESAVMSAEITSLQGMSAVRHKLMKYLRSKGLSGDELGLFLTGVGEAMTNAVKHGREGCVYAGVDEEQCVWVAVSDHGAGIETLSLPGATLLRGFSTKISMGMGYSIMIEVSDRVLLYTGNDGTTVILKKCSRKPQHSMSLDDIPDIWSEIG